MPIDNLPARYRELGRLKFGEDLGDRPTQLETWRIVSPNVELIEAAAHIFGGTVIPGDESSEVVTTTADLPVLIPAQDVAAGQWWEHWTAGGLQRRCTGSALVDYAPEEPTGFRKVAPCICDEENRPRVCKPTTVLRVLLPQLPDLGVWKLTTRSVYAAAELPAAADFLLQTTGGNPAAALLGLDRRHAKTAGGPRRDFTVPVLRVRSTLAELTASPAASSLELPFDTTTAPAQTPQLPQNTPETAPDELPGPTTPETPQTGDTGEPRRSPEREALAAFLEDVDPGNVSRDPEVLVPFLEELEALAIAAGVWKPGALDVAADRYLEGRPWRERHGYELATFTTRALLSVIGERPNP